MLKKSIEYLQSILSKNSRLTFYDQGIFSTTNFIAGIIIGRSCSKEQFGLYMLGLTIITIFTEFQTSFISIPFTINIPKYSSDKKKLYTGSIITHQLLMISLAFIIYQVVSLFIPCTFFFDGLFEILQILMVTLYLFLLRDLLRKIYFALLEIDKALHLDTAVGLLQVFGLFLLSYYEVLTAENAFIILGLGNGLIGIIWIFRERNLYKIDLKQVVKDIQENYFLGKWIYLSSLLWSLSSNLYPWILTGHHGTEAAGIWAASNSVVALINPLYIGMQNFVTPKIAYSYASGGINELQQFTRKATIIIGFVILICVLVIILMPNFFIVLFYGDKYDNNGLLISILAINTLLVACGFSFSRAFFVLKKANIDFEVNVLSIIILLTFGLWVTEIYGAIGAAICLLIGNFVGLIVRFFVFKKIKNKE